METDKAFRSPLRERLYRIIFGTDTPAGKLFDVVLLWAIVISVALVMLESVREIGDAYGVQLHWAEAFFTALFTVEYLLRLWVVDKPIRYARSFFGIIDLLSILPTFLVVFIPGCAVVHGDPCLAPAADLPDPEAGPVHRRSERAGQGTLRKP